MKKVTFNISFEIEDELDYVVAQSIVSILKSRSKRDTCSEMQVEPAEAEQGPAAPAAPATPAVPAVPEAKAPTAVAPEAKVPETKAPAAPASEAKAAAKVEYTCEDARKAMASKLANHRTALVDKLRSLGAKNISTLPQDKYAEFIDFCNSLTD